MTIDYRRALLANSRLNCATFHLFGARERMQQARTKMLGFHTIESAAHWLKQEQPEKLTGLITGFWTISNRKKSLYV